jgi:VCBS repeat-containing protein
VCFEEEKAQKNYGDNMKTKRKLNLFILALLCLLTSTANILAQYPPIDIPDGYQSTPLSDEETLVDSFLMKGESALTNSPNTENLTSSAQIVGGSNLIDQAQANQIAGYLNGGSVTLTRIFSKTQGDGKVAPDFHAAADNQGRTITVYRVQYNGQQYLIGGYNPQSWNSSSSYNMTPNDADRTAFLFNLTSDFVQRQKLNNDPSCPGCGQYQTYNYNGYGPTFGGGHDLYSDYSLQSGYANNWGYGASSIFNNNILNINIQYTGYPNLQILGFEVFKVSECVGYEFVGSYRTSNGPQWPSNPPTYTGQEAAALLFGGSASDYAISINSSQDPSTITHTAWVDGWGSILYFGATPAPENYKKNTFYNCGSTGCSYSAYVMDHVNTSKINYVWRKVLCQTNSAPSAGADSYSTSEDTPLSISAPGLLVNDTDADGDGLQVVTTVVDAPDFGSVTLSANGSFTYTPNQDYNGPDSFKYKVNDGQVDSTEATVSITVNPVNDAPSLSGVPASTTISELAPYGFTAAANDVDSNTLTFSLVGAPTGASIDATTGQFSWTPDETQGPGSYSFSVRISDGELNTDANISLTVSEVNSAPNLSNVPSSATIDELVQYSFTAVASDSDVPVQTLTFSLNNGPAGAGIDSTGKFTWTPSEAQGTGFYNFDVMVSDGTATAISPVQLIVNEVNSAPVLAAIGDQTLDEETVLSGVAASATDSDDPVNTLTYSLDTAPTGMTINGSTGAISWTPTEAQGAGDYPVTVKVTDNGAGNLTDTKSFSVHVNEVNLAPVLGAIGSSTIDEQVPFSFTASATDADLPANGLTYSLISAPAGASINPTTGQFTWTPSEAQGGNPNTPHTFTVRVTDDGSPNLTDEETITLTVREVNIAPVLGSITNQTGFWGNAFTFTATASDSDIPANALTYSLVGAPAGASINPTTGAFTWTPTSAQLGANSFKVRVTDNGTPNLSDEKNVTITVGARPTTLVYTGDGSEQYSDQQALSAGLTDNGGGALQGLPVSGKTIGFAIGTESASGTTNGSGVAAANLILTQDPAGNYTVVSNFAGDSLYLASSDSDAFDIVQEDARAYYTGTLYATANSSGAATLTLSATIKDITAEGSDPATDSFAGDITKATVDFVNRDNGTVCANRPVGLVALGDSKIGTATCNWNAGISSGDAAQFTIGTIVKNYYTRNNSDDNTVVTIAKSAPGLITGGGFLLMENPTKSTGLYPGAAGTKTNFGFNIKNETKNGSPKGNINVIIRNGGRVYQIKGNAMTSLGTQPNSTGGKATFNGKANIQDITDPLNVISIDGNATLQVTLTDNGNSGDLIGITVWNKSGGLWYASRWDGTKTVEQTLGGGNLVVR